MALFGHVTGRKKKSPDGEFKKLPPIRTNQPHATTDTQHIIEARVAGIDQTNTRTSCSLPGSPAHHGQHTTLHCSVAPRAVVLHAVHTGGPRGAEAPSAPPWSLMPLLRAKHMLRCRGSSCAGALLVAGGASSAPPWSLMPLLGAKHMLRCRSCAGALLVEPRQHHHGA